MLGAADHVLRAAVVLLVVAPAASAQRAEITQEVFDREGLPVLVANPVPDGAKGEVVAWRSCPPAEACVPLPLPKPSPRGLEPGDVAAGTAFEVDVRARDGELTTDRSLPWRGRVTATSPPAVGGALRVGRIARVVPAAWSGGWRGDGSLLRLEACRTAAGTRCETLSAQGEDPPVCPGAAVVLGRRYAGWWVRAVDQRVARDTAFAGVGYARPRDIPIARVSPTTVRSPLAGPVRAARARPVRGVRGARGRPARDVRSGRRSPRGGFVRCVSACRVQIVVRDARRTFRRRDERDGATSLGVRVGGPLAGDAVTVRVVVNGRHRARASVPVR